MTLSTLFARVLAALAQPRLGMAVAFSCAITAGVAGPMAYQATHYQAVERSSAPGVHIVEPARHGRPTSPSASSSSSTSSTLSTSTTSTTSPPTTVPARPGTTAPRSGSSTTQAATTTSGQQPRLHTQISVAGSLVAGRRGAVAVQVSADGGSVSHVHLSITAVGATPTPSLTDGWTCTAGPTINCDDQTTLSPAASDTVFVALDVAPTASNVALSASSTAPGTSASTDASTTSRLATSNGFSARFAGVVRGDVTTVGNTLSTCPPGATIGTVTCEQAAARDNSITDGQNNNDWSMVPVDADDDPATANSSAAMLSTPGNDVVSASLYWSAGQAAGAGGSDATGPIGTALFATPATTGGGLATAASYSTVTATQIDQAGSSYQAYADVTQLVQAAGPGRYWLGGVAAATGTNTEAGWSLTVVYRQAGAPPRTILIFDGLVHVDDGTQTLQASGFRVSGTSSARLGLVGYEGDDGLRGDAVSCGTSPPLSDGSRDPDNFFNSSITHNGAVDTSGTPAQANTFGLDIADLDVSPSVVPGCLSPGSSSTSLQFSTTSDQYLVGVVTLSATR